jgi:hypothetical protein
VERVQIAHTREPECRADGEGDGAGRQADLGDDEKAAPVEAIGDDAAEQGKRDQWDRLKEPDQADVER